MSGFYIEYLESLCRRRGWSDPIYDISHGSDGCACYVLVNGRKYQTDLSYETPQLARENAAMRAFMVCRNFSVNGGMLARNGVVQGLPAPNSTMVAGVGMPRAGPGFTAPQAMPSHQAHPRMGRSGSSSSSNASYD